MTKLDMLLIFAEGLLIGYAIMHTIYVCINQDDIYLKECEMPKRTPYKSITNKQAIKNHIDNLTVQETLNILDGKVEGRE